MAVRAATTIGMAGVGLAGVLAGAVLVAGGDAAAATPCAATATPTATATATATATPTATATSTATPTASSSASPSGSATPSATASPTGGGILPGFPVPIGGQGQGTTTATPGPSGSATASSTASAASKTTVSLLPRRVVKGESVRVTGTGPAGCRVDVLGYTRPSSTYRVIRSGTIADNGSFGFTLYPPANTRVYARSQGASNSPTTTVNVRFLVSLKATRIGTRVERFEGGVAPGRANVPVTVYRQTSSGNVKVGTTVTESDGSWSLVQQFSGTGTFSFFAVAHTTADNDSNRSPIVRATIS